MMLVIQSKKIDYDAKILDIESRDKTRILVDKSAIARFINNDGLDKS